MHIQYSIITSHKNHLKHSKKKHCIPCWTNFSPVGTPLVAAIGVAGWRRLMADTPWCYRSSHLFYTQSTNHNRTCVSGLRTAGSALQGTSQILPRPSDWEHSYRTGKVTSPQTVQEIRNDCKTLPISQTQKTPNSQKLE